MGKNGTGWRQRNSRAPMQMRPRAQRTIFRTLEHDLELVVAVANHLHIVVTHHAAADEEHVAQRGGEAWDAAGAHVSEMCGAGAQLRSSTAARETWPQRQLTASSNPSPGAVKGKPWLSLGPHASWSRVGPRGIAVWVLGEPALAVASGTDVSVKRPSGYQPL